MALSIKSLAIVDDNEPSRGPGHPAYMPHPQIRNLVEVLIAIGASQEAICRELVQMGEPCADVRTLKRAFASELEHGRERRVLAYGVKVHAMAMGTGPGALAACKFMLGVLGGPQWRIPRDEDVAPPLPDLPGLNGNGHAGGAVHIVIPDNGRGFPEGVKPNTVTIEGVAELSGEDKQTP
jgi:hypothetical protein